MTSAQMEFATPLRRLSSWAIDGVSFVLVGPAIFFVVAILAFTIDDLLWDLPTWSRHVGSILFVVVIYAILIVEWLFILKLTVMNKWQIVSILSPIILLFILSIFATVLVAMSSLIACTIWTLFLSSNGQTVGKRLVGIRAVQQNRRPISWGLMFLREIIKFLLHIFMIGFIIDGIMMLSDKTERQSVADRIAGTVVIRIDR